jgi:hypothetical protein
MTPETNALLFAAGLALAGYVTITLVTAVTVEFQNETANSPAWRRIALRALEGQISVPVNMPGLLRS